MTTIKDQKDKIELESEKLEKELDKQLDQVLDKTEKWARNILLAGTALIIGYKLFQLFTSEEDSDEAQSEQKRKDIFNKVIELVGKEVGFLILAFLKNKLLDYLNQKDVIASTEDEKEVTTE